MRVYFRILAAYAVAVASAAALFAFGPSACAKGPDLKPAPAPDAYATEIRPIIATYCLGCHGEKKPKADLNLAAFQDEKSVLAARKTWKEVWKMLQIREMPPEEKPQPTPAERERVTDWIEAALGRATADSGKNPGRMVMRRLNRVEYANTIRDLLAIDFKPVEDFPSDEVGYGFDNIGDLLSLQPLLLEKYLAAAEKILTRAVSAGTPPRGPIIRRFEAERMKTGVGTKVDGEVHAFSVNSEIGQSVDLPADGEYIVRWRATGDQAGTEPVKMSVRIDGQESKVFDITTARAKLRTYEVRPALKAGRRRFSAAFINDLYRPEAKDPKDRDRNLYVDYFEIEGPVNTAPHEPPESHKRIFVAKPSDGKSKREAAREILANFTPRAFRRPVAPEEIDRLLKLYDTAEQNGDAFEAAMKLPLQAVLVSPHFLFRVERDRPADPRAVRPVDDFELAVRLSYFIWSSMPDAELFDLARAGKLREPATLEAQARRMLKDAKAQALASNFAVQWLQLRRLETAQPDRKRFGAFDEPLRQAMLQEAVLFFDEIRREDRSVLEILDADYTYVNERLARHYGIAGVAGPEMRRVALADRRRGGVMTLAGVLTVTSNPTRTSAVKRGKWVLETILGTPPPPPVPDAGELKDEAPEGAKMTLRRRLEQHRADPNCASCHNKMDPIGFGFENYDAIGAWRDKEGGLAIDVSATLPDGRSFNGPVELKALLVSRKDDFVRCLSEKLLTFALGRGLEYYDSGTVKKLKHALEGNNYRFSTLVVEIAGSYPFLNRRTRSVGESDE